MKVACTRQGPGVTRRQLLATAGAGTGAIALGGLGFTGAPLVAQSIQIGGTPAAPALPTGTQATGETVAAVAERLGYDTGAIFAFVRDEISYESYPGVLRGATGTLWARAGNSADQAMLLGALLAAAQVPHRFASGPLAAAPADQLAASLSRTAEESLAAYGNANVAGILALAGLDEEPATPPAATPGLDDLDARFGPASEAALDHAAASAQASRTAIASALAAAGITLPLLPAASLPNSERTDHAWVQVADGPNWVDFDPSLPEGESAGTASATYDALPDAWNQQVKLAIVADDNLGGALSRREVASLTAPAQLLVDVPVALSMASANEIAGLGLVINEAISGQKTIYPSIYADNTTVDAIQPLLFSTDAGGSAAALGGTPPPATGAADGETIAVWLLAEVTVPGATPVVILRPLLDRLPPEDRAAETFDPARITPLQTVPTEMGDVTPDAFATLTIVHADVARIPPWAALSRAAVDEVFGPSALFGPTLAGFRDILGALHETDAGAWSYPAAPNLTMINLRPPDPGSADPTARIAVDLLYRNRVVLPHTDAAAGASHPLVEAGVLNAVAEQVLLLPETRGEAGGEGYAAGPSVAGIFEAAQASGVDITAITPGTDLATLSLDPVSEARIVQSIADGKVVVCPVQPIEIDGAPVLGWWIVDPATGETTDQLQDGSGGASVIIPARPGAMFAGVVEDSFLTRAIAWVAARSRAFICLGFGAAGGFMWAAALVKAIRGSNLARMAAAGGLGGAGAAAGGKLAGCF